MSIEQEKKKLEIVLKRLMKKNPKMRCYLIEKDEGELWH